MKTEQILMVPRDCVAPNPNQPRKVFDTVKLQELADSIVASHGIQTPLLCRPWKAPDAGSVADKLGVGRKAALESNGKRAPVYEIVFGERRWRSAALAKLQNIPIVVRNLDDQEVFRLQLIENQQRENLSALEEAEAYAKEIARRKQADPKYGPEDLAREIGQSRATVYERLKLTRLHPPVRAALVAGKISTSVAGLVALIPEPNQQEKLVKTITNERDYDYPYSFRAVQEMVDEDYVRQLSDAPFDQKRIYGTDGAKGTNEKQLPACAECPHRSGNMVNEFPDLAKRPNVCTKTSCFEQKTRLHTEAKLSEAKAKGQQVVAPEVYRKANYGTYREGSDTCYQASGGQSWASLARKAKVEPIVTVNDEGAAVEVFDRSAQAKILAANKIRSSGGGGSGDSYGRARMKRKKENSAIAWAATGQLLARLVTGRGIDAKLWRPLADGVAQLIGIEREANVAKRRGLAEKITEVRDALEGWLTGPRTNRELQEFIVEALLCASWDDWEGRLDADFKKLCADNGVNVDKVKKGVEAARTKPKSAGKLLALPAAKRKGMSAAARAHVAAAAKARWAKMKAAK